MEHSTAAGNTGGTWIREPDGAMLLMYSPILFVDPPTALRLRRPEDRWYRVAYDKLPVGVSRPTGVEQLSPGEWIRIH